MSCSQKNKFTIFGREVGSAVAELAVVGIALLLGAVAYFSYLLPASMQADFKAKIHSSAQLAQLFAAENLKGSSTLPGDALDVAQQSANAALLANFLFANLGVPVCVTPFQIRVTADCSSANVTAATASGENFAACNGTLSGAAAAVQSAALLHAPKLCDDKRTFYVAVAQSPAGSTPTAVTDALIIVTGDQYDSIGATFATPTPGGSLPTPTPIVAPTNTPGSRQTPTPRPTRTPPGTPTYVPPTAVATPTFTPGGSGTAVATPGGGGGHGSGGGFGQVQPFDPSGPNGGGFEQSDVGPVPGGFEGNGGKGGFESSDAHGHPHF